VGEQRISVYLLKPNDRPFFKLEWVVPGTDIRRSKSAKTADPAEAERKRADLEYELNHGLHHDPCALTWEAFRQVFEDEVLSGLRPKTREKYGSVFDVFEQIARPLKLRDVDERCLSRFAAGMLRREVRGGKVGLAAWTQRNYLVALKTALGWAVEQGMLPALPKCRKIKVPKKKPQPIAAEDFEKLLAQAPDDTWRAYLLCGWWAGLRLSEARELRWEPSDAKPWLDLPRNRIVLPAAFAKSDEDQSVPLHPVLREALEKVPRVAVGVFPFRSRRGGGPLSDAGLSQYVRMLAKRAGVLLSMHRLRKGFGCRVAKQLGKGNAPLLHTLMRHSSMQVTMDFYASVDDAVQDAIKELT
jgi:integrase